MFLLEQKKKKTLFVCPGSFLVKHETEFTQLFNESIIILDETIFYDSTKKNSWREFDAIYRAKLQITILQLNVDFIHFVEPMKIVLLQKSDADWSKILI